MYLTCVSSKKTLNSLFQVSAVRTKLIKFCFSEKKLLPSRIGLHKHNFIRMPRSTLKKKLIHNCRLHVKQGVEIFPTVKYSTLIITIDGHYLICTSSRWLDQNVIYRFIHTKLQNTNLIVMITRQVSKIPIIKTY